ncbi:MAG: carbonic anhydrase [bacterium]
MISHNDEAVLIVRCMDKRLPGAVVEYLRRTGRLGHCYDPARAGAAKGLLDPEKPGLAESIWNDIAIGVDKGGVKQIILCHHTDCAAYGGSRQFSSFEEECKFQIEEMRRARELILAKYPDIKISLVLAKIIGQSGRVEFEEKE